jgi:hypothetical protein
MMQSWRDSTDIKFLMQYCSLETKCQRVQIRHILFLEIHVQ